MKKSTGRGSSKKKILLLGHGGMLAHDLFNVLSGEYIVTGREEAETDVTLATDISRAISAARPDYVLNAAGYTGVDNAETEREKAMKVNGYAPGLISRACRESGAVLVHYSSDYIFNGTAKRPYDEEDEPLPINYYGVTKLEGEREILSSGCEHIIIRTQWLYGPKGKNFVFSIVDRLKKYGSARVVDDQVGCPTYTVDLAGATRDLISSGCRGVYNFSSSGEASWFDFAKKISELSIPDPVEIEPIKSVDISSMAKRPSYSVLSKEKYSRETGTQPRDWGEMLPDFLKRVFEGGVAW